MRRNGFTLVELLIVVAIIGILAALLFPVFPHRTGRGSAQRSSCQSSLKRIGLGIAQYIQDYDDRLPLISAGKKGWAEEIQPYLKSWQIFQCPSGKKPYEQNEPLTSDYFLNARVAGLKRSKIPFGSQTLLLGEGPDNGGTNSHFSELPFDWLTAEKSPAKRHLTGANYAFVDGHVKWIRPEKISTLPPTKNEGNWKATFAVR